jgi:hypothetical protein
MHGIFIPLSLNVIPSLEARFLLSQIAYYSRKGNSFYKFTAPAEKTEEYREGDSWTELLGISEHKVRKAKKYLIEKGFIKTTINMCRKTTYYITEQGSELFKDGDKSKKVVPKAEVKSEVSKAEEKSEVPKETLQEPEAKSEVPKETLQKPEAKSEISEVKSEVPKEVKSEVSEKTLQKPEAKTEVVKKIPEPVAEIGYQITEYIKKEMLIDISGEWFMNKFLRSRIGVKYEKDDIFGGLDILIDKSINKYDKSIIANVENMFAPFHFEASINEFIAYKSEKAEREKQRELAYLNPKNKYLPRDEDLMYIDIFRFLYIKKYGRESHDKEMPIFEKISKNSGLTMAFIKKKGGKEDILRKLETREEPLEEFAKIWRKDREYAVYREERSTYTPIFKEPLDASTVSKLKIVIYAFQQGLLDCNEIKLKSATENKPLAIEVIEEVEKMKNSNIADAFEFNITDALSINLEEFGKE